MYRNSPLGEWQQINFNVWHIRTGHNEFVYQALAPWDKVTHAAKLESNVLIINNEDPIKVMDFDEAVKLAKVKEDIDHAG